jgi:hypothetical protein
MAEIVVDVATYVDSESGEPYVVVVFSGFDSMEHAQRNALAIHRSVASVGQEMRLN